MSNVVQLLSSNSSENRHKLCESNDSACCDERMLLIESEQSKEQHVVEYHSYDQEQEYEESECEEDTSEETVPFLMPNYITQKVKHENSNNSNIMRNLCLEQRKHSLNTSSSFVNQNNNNKNINNITAIVRDNASDSGTNDMTKINNTIHKPCEVDVELLSALEEITLCRRLAINQVTRLANYKQWLKSKHLTKIIYHSQPVCEYLLQKYFHIASGQFRPKQDEVCFAALYYVNTLAVCPTGWGKSLCYQFPMLVHRLLFNVRYALWMETREHTCDEANTTFPCNDNVPCKGKSRSIHYEKVDDNRIRSSSSINTNTESVLLPPHLHSKLCLVISPLLALMSDQVAKINETNILKAVSITSQMSANRFELIVREIMSPICNIDIIFISPERLVSDMTLRELLFRQQLHRLALVCVDEVHCVSQWGFDFRPAYMYVSALCQTIMNKHSSFGSEGTVVNDQCTAELLPAMLCLTATATFDVKSDIIEKFCIAHTIICTTPREHLQLQVVNLLEKCEERLNKHDNDINNNNNNKKNNNNNDDNVMPNENAYELISQGTQNDNEQNNFTACASTRIERVWHDVLVESATSLPTPMLIYVQTRADADEIANLLGHKLHVMDVNTTTTTATSKQNAEIHSTQKSIFTVCSNNKQDKRNSNHGSYLHQNNKTNSRVVRCYHAALSPAVRRATQEQFSCNKIDILVATVAFGMGIDMRHIRTVLHASAPSSIEHYIQETGRAGRDGQESVCRLLYNPMEYYELRTRLLASFISPIEMNEVVQRIIALPYTHYGEKLMLISPSRLATEMEINEEVIETVMFMLLTLNCNTKYHELSELFSSSSSVASNTNDNKNDKEKVKPVFEYLHGQAIETYILSSEDKCKDVSSSDMTTAIRNSNRINCTNNTSDEFDNNSNSRKRFRNVTTTRSSNATKVKSRTNYTTRKNALNSASCVSSSSSNFSYAVGVSSLLQQLNVKDPVLCYCNEVMATKTHRCNVIEMANYLKLSFNELQYRLDDLLRSDCIHVRRTTHAYLVTLSSFFTETAHSLEQINELAALLYEKYNSHLEHKLYSLGEMFRILAQPTHEALQSALDTPYKKVITSSNYLDWTPALVKLPTVKRMKKIDAVAIANSFVEENRSRINNVYEAARALLGVRPRSIIKYGKYAGQLPLSASWYVKSPYFGALREFDLRWVISVLKAHNIDAHEHELFQNFDNY